MAPRRVSGASETANAFRSIARLVAGPGNEACKRALEPTLAAAQQNIQDDGSIATGELLKGLIVKRMRSPATRPQYRVGVDPDSPARSQAHLLEFDTAPHINAGKFAGSQHPGTKGTRFMTRAYEATKQEAVAIFGRVFGPAVEKQAARLAARAAKKAQG